MNRTMTMVCAAMAIAGSAAWAQVSSETVAGVTNFRQVKSTVACAGATTPEAMRGIKEMGYASVVNLRLASENGADVEAGSKAAAAAGLKYLHIPMSGAAPDPAAFDQFIAAARVPANQPMFVHCASGNRAAAAWLARRVLVDGWTTDRAVEEAKGLGLSNPKLQQVTLEYVQSRQGK